MISEFEQHTHRYGRVEQFNAWALEGVLLLCSTFLQKWCCVRCSFCTGQSALERERGRVWDLRSTFRLVSLNKVSFTGKCPATLSRLIRLGSNWNRRQKLKRGKFEWNYRETEKDASVCSEVCRVSDAGSHWSAGLVTSWTLSGALSCVSVLMNINEFYRLLISG